MEILSDNIANGFKPTAAWAVFNLFFLLETMVIRVIDNVISPKEELLFKIIISAVIITELVISFILFYRIGKRAIDDMGNRFFTFLSIFSVHVIILIILIALNSFIGFGLGRILIAWYQEIIFVIFGWFSFISDFLLEIFCNPVAIITNTLIPYVVMYIGFLHGDNDHKQEKEEEISA